LFCSRLAQRTTFEGCSPLCPRSSARRLGSAHACTIISYAFHAGAFIFACLPKSNSAYKHPRAAHLRRDQELDAAVPVVVSQWNHQPCFASLAFAFNFHNSFAWCLLRIWSVRLLGIGAPKLSCGVPPVRRFCVISVSFLIFANILRLFLVNFEYISRKFLVNLCVFFFLFCEFGVIFAPCLCHAEPFLR